MHKYPESLYDAVTTPRSNQQENLKYQSCKDAVYDLSSPTSGRSILRISPHKLDSREPLQPLSQNSKPCLSASKQLLKRPEQAQVAQLIKQIVFIERDCESQKIDLALKSDFNLIDCFRAFDIHAKGNLTHQTFVDGLQLILGYRGSLTPQDVQLIFARFTKRDRVMSFQAFSEMLLPFSQEFN